MAQGSQSIDTSRHSEPHSRMPRSALFGSSRKGKQRYTTASAGIFLSVGLGKAVFGVAARPRLIVYPVAVALTIIVAILSAYPLRRLASIRPASVFRGEA